ncbi:Nose resistant to fluoxetine protein 6 like protein [Argiope bruennichi]|uniref:Nose resistant to fluoxetine protein 6 like protein n=1 Tax=Argiope bruennichi TaxID=94029 RepID=A0A8T0EPV3_ARGBR|nr:Nose resistant to fluoxetine protein 6 like protein [Argiope bruennichi]
MLLSVLILVFISCCRVSGTPTTSNETKSDSEKYYNLTEKFEKQWKVTIKGAIKPLMPFMLRMNEENDLSGSCRRALMLYLSGLNQAKVWAIRMLDATSKLPPGVLQGTFVDYGSFDECLAVEGPGAKFTGQSCAIEARPPLPPLSPGYTLVKTHLNGNNGTLSGYFRVTYEALHHKKLRVVACVPSSCSLQDMRVIARKVAEETDFDIKIPQCYKKEAAPLQAIHWTVIFFLGLLLILCLIGTGVELFSEKKASTLRSLLEAFLVLHGRRLFSAPGGSSTEFCCIHGVRALTMCWVVLGHTYVLMDFELLKDPSEIQGWFKALEFELIHNGWLSVETFFLLSGILVTVGGLKFLQKSKGCFNVPVMALRRYFRLTPSLLLLMGLVFFLPLIGSGPFWYQHVDPQVESCAKYWWTSLLFISNWFGIDKGCTLVTWYLAADLQLYIVALFFLLVLNKYCKLGLAILVLSIVVSCIAVGLQTLVHKIMPSAMISAVNNDKVHEVLNHVHVYTLTHLGPYCLGMLLGYIVFKYKEHKLAKGYVISGWLLSILLGMSSVLGTHRFSTGEEESRAWPSCTPAYTELSSHLLSPGSSMHASRDVEVL